MAPLPEPHTPALALDSAPVNGAGMRTARVKVMTIQATTIEREPSSRRAASADILTRLKLETAREHAAIEGATGIMRADLSLADYRDYLECSYGFYAPVEATLEWFGVWDALGLKAAERMKLPLLERDLAILGRDIAALPRCDAPPRLGSLDEALGAVYVLEGSTLGGRVISRHLRGQFGNGLPLAFLDAYGEKTGESWQALRQALRDHATSRSVENRIIVGAKATFDSFTRWLVRSRQRHV